MIETVDNLWLSRSWTTRSRRPNEPEDAYYFVTEEEFKLNIEQNGFLEWAKFLDHYYGTPKPEHFDEHDIVLEIDIQGARQVVDNYRSISKMILLVPPSNEILFERLSKRGDPIEHIKKRIELAVIEIDQGRQFADEIVVNDELGATVAKIADIIDRWRS